jgi:uncharacterized membrane protein YfcA
VITTTDDVLLVGAGIVAGVVGTAGGITSLVSYPALLWVGIPPVAANVANIVALVTTMPGSAMASGPELQGRGRWLSRWAGLTFIGGAAGAGLLLSTPASLFGRVVPFLIAAAALGLLLQPRISAWKDPRPSRAQKLVLPCGLVLVSVYTGYFGAGSGVMALALLLLTMERHVARANALKNVLVGAANVAAAALLVLWGPVDWGAVVPLSVGAFAGSTVGPWVARRVPGDVLRWAVALVGLGLAVRLWLDPA